MPSSKLVAVVRDDMSTTDGVEMTDRRSTDVVPRVDLVGSSKLEPLGC